MKTFLTVLRWLPFIIVGAASLWASARTGHGYRAPVFDWDLTWPAIANALTKLPHVSSMLLIFLLAALATGVGRLRLAAALALVIGVGWEIVQMPTIDNHARLADLVPDLVGIAIGWAAVTLAVGTWHRLRQRKMADDEERRGKTTPLL